MTPSEFREFESTLGPTFSTKQPVYIYGLVDPETGEIRYIGKSIRPAERLQNHMNELSNCHRSHWLQSLKAPGLRADMVILERIDGEWPWQHSERHWIAYGRANGWPLTNNTDGGDGVPGLSGPSKERMASTWKGRKHKPESIEKMLATKKERPHSHSAETRARMSVAHAGRDITWGDKLSVALRRLTEEQVEEIKLRFSAGERTTDLAKEYGVHRTTMSKIKMGTYHDKYRN